MVRTLLLIAGAAFAATLACFAIAVSLGPFDWRPWAYNHGEWGRPSASGDGPEVSREIAWTGGDELNVRLPAEVVYTQGSPARLVVTGRQAAVEHVVLDGHTLRFDRRVRRSGGVRIQLTAPDVNDFSLAGAHTLRIEGYDQDNLDINMAGSGDVVGRGRARSLDVRMAGSGDVDLRDLPVEDADLDIAGSGDTVLAATGTVDINIAGSGDVTLTTRPRDLDTHVFGSGRITQPPAAPEPAAPAKAPADAA
jgi:hypothetical protein